MQLSSLQLVSMCKPVSPHPQACQTMGIPLVAILDAGWVLFQISFRAHKEIEEKMKDWWTIHSGPFFVDTVVLPNFDIHEHVCNLIYLAPRLCPDIFNVK